MSFEIIKQDDAMSTCKLFYHDGRNQIEGPWAWIDLPTDSAFETCKALDEANYVTECVDDNFEVFSSVSGQMKFEELAMVFEKCVAVRYMLDDISGYLKGFFGCNSE